MAAHASFSRWGWMLLAGAVSLATPQYRCAAEDPVPLLGDYPAAVAQAQREGRLLFVLHLSGDFAAASVPGEIGEGYRELALNDEQVQELLRSHFVVTFRHVGTPASLNLVAVRGKLKVAEPLQQHAIAYICLPDQRVIHFIPGFVTAEELLAELAWARNCYFDFVRFPDSEQPAAARQLHLASAGADNVELFAKGMKTRWLLDSPVREDDVEHLAAVVQQARKVRTTRLDERFAGPENALLARSFYDALADHAPLGPSPAHLILSEYPLASLDILARPLYETWTSDQFWALGPRRKELQSWFQARHGKGQPLLLAVTGSAPTGQPEAGQLFAWPLSGKDGLSLKEFEVIELSLEELMMLVGDVGLAPLAAQRDDLPRFVLFDRAGRRRAVLTRRDGIAKLRTMLRTCAQPGVAATSKTEK